MLAHIRAEPQKWQTHNWQLVKSSGYAKSGYGVLYLIISKGLSLH